MKFSIKNTKNKRGARPSRPSRPSRPPSPPPSPSVSKIDKAAVVAEASDEKKDGPGTVLSEVTDRDVLLGRGNGEYYDYD
jgi:hypothetical protein